MADQEVKIEYSATDQQVLKSLQATERALNSVADRMTDVERKSKSASHTAEEGFATAAKEIEKMALELVGLTSVMAAVDKLIEKLKAEYENVRNRQEGAGKAQLALAPQLKQTQIDVGNLLGGPDKTRELIRQLGITTGAGEQKAAAVLDRSIVASGAASAKDPKKAAARAADIAAMLLQRHPEMEAGDLESMVGAMTKMGEHAPQMTPAQIMTFVEEARRQAGLGGPEALGKHIAPALAMGEHAGMNPQRTLALYAALAHGTGDSTGKLATSAMTELVQAIEQRYPGRDPWDVIQELQGDPKKADYFWHGGFFGKAGKHEAPHFGPKVEGAVRGLLSGKGPEADRMKAAEKILSDQRAMERRAKEEAQGLASQPEINTQEMLHALEAATQRANLENTDEGRAGKLREGVIEYLKALKASKTAQEWAGLGFDFDTMLRAKDPAETAIALLRGAADKLDKKAPPSKASSFGGGEGGLFSFGRLGKAIARDGKEPSDEARKSAAQMRETADKLAEIRESEGKALEQRDKDRSDEKVMQDRKKQLDNTPAAILSRERLADLFKRAGLPADDPLLRGLFKDGDVVGAAEAKGAVQDEALGIERFRMGRDARGNPAKIRRVPGEALSPEEEDRDRALNRAGHALDDLSHQKAAAADASQSSIGPIGPRTPGDDKTAFKLDRTNRLLEQLVAQGSRPTEVTISGGREYATEPASAAYDRVG